MDAVAKPRTATERCLVDIWADALGLAHVGIHDNFVDLGGHSIAAVRCAWLVKAQLGVEIAPDAFLLDTGTIAELAEMIDGASAR